MSLHTVALLMTDLVGSTEMSSRLGPHAGESIRREHFKLLRVAMERTGGREVKSLGDGLMAVFDNPSDALGCAVQMQQGVDAGNRRSKERCEIRIGVSFGEVTLENGDYFGAASVEAARLCAMADGGQILITSIVRQLAGSRDEHDFRPLGVLELKGLHPVEALELLWEPLLVAGIPLPERLAEAARSPFSDSLEPVEMVGREAELGELTKLWGQASEGSLRVALVGGEAGVGKTRLSTQLALQLHATGATVVYGRCDEDLGVPYQPWLEALGHLVEHVPESILEQHVKGRGGELARIIPAIRERVPSCPPPRQSDPETERYLLYAAAAGLIEDVAMQGPVLLILDDLHWADGPTLSLLRSVVSAAPVRAMVLGNYRGSELSRQHPLTPVLADLHREQRVSRVTLTGLRSHDVLALIEAADQEHPFALADGDEEAEVEVGGPELARQVTEETAGNSFFALEVIRHLREARALVQFEEGRWRLARNLAELGLPQSVIEVIGRRVERLGSEAQEALGAASVIGRDFDLDLLGAVLKVDPGRLMDTLEGAIKGSLVEESKRRPGGFTFTHALVEHALYEDLGAVRRNRLHRSVAEALEDRYAGDPGERLGELAAHWAAAVVTIDAAKASHYAQLAGERALQQLAPDEAIRWYGQALELLAASGSRATPAVRCELLIGLGEAQRQTGDPTFRETLLRAADLARELDDTELLVRSVLANNRGFASNFGGVDAQRVRGLEDAAAALRDNDPRRAEVLALLAAELQFGGEPERCEALAEEAIELARESGDRATLARAMTDGWGAIVAPHTLEQRRRMIDELSELAGELGDPRLIARTAARRMLVGLEVADRKRVELGLESLRSVARKVPEPWIAYLHLLLEFGWTLLGGDLRTAERVATEAFELGSAAAQPDAAIFYGAHMFHVRYFEGRAGELTEQVLALAGEGQRLSGWRAGAAALTLIQGNRPDEARDLALAEDFGAIAHDEAWSLVMMLWGDACSLIDATGPAETILELLSPFSGQLAVSGAHVYGSIDFALGALAATLGRYEEADRHFAAAAELESRLEAPLLLARTHARWARSLIAGGHAEEMGRAETMLERADRAARRAGAGGIMREVEESRRQLVTIAG
ncbi:MAG TPA: AAA family ATPase [Solirubrobacteraceae bacterium]|nr:AAA family ATPase [Solirubrobacteraceae bacterium]